MLVANRLWLSVISDELTPNGEAQVLSAKDYYPFGMSMPSRTTEGGTYRYGFNGKETDHETGIQDYGMRWYLPNIARFPSVDPLEKSYPWNSVYTFAEGNPIEFIDLDGGERKHYKIEFDQKTHKPNLTFVKQEDIVTLHPVSVAEPLSGQLEYEARTNEYEEYVLHKPITAYLWREGVDPKRMDGEVTFTTRDWSKVQNAQETDFPSSTWRWVLAQHHQNTRDGGAPITFGVRPITRFIKNKYPTTATIYRTQGGVPPNASRERISLNENGEVSISGRNMLYVTINDKNHQIYFYYKRGGSEQGISIVSFKIPRALADEIKEAAVPQALGKHYPNNPQISDPTKSTGAYGLPKIYIDKIQNQAIKGSFKILKPK